MSFYSNPGMTNLDSKLRLARNGMSSVYMSLCAWQGHDEGFPKRVTQLWVVLYESYKLFL
mgnify:FL=1